MRALLMGGQACVLYGAAEFSRDTDFAVLCNADNLVRLQNALDELHAERIAVPAFELSYLERGHAIHFRCTHPDAAGLRVDVMARMRGVDAFEALWERRTSVDLEGETIEVLALPDLVAAKKTQRDKDWPMIRRLLEVHYLENRDTATPQQVAFWLRELRTPSLLLEVARHYPQALQQHQACRAVLQTLDNEEVLETALHQEEQAERRRDRDYWKPLKAELEQLRWRRD